VNMTGRCAQQSFRYILREIKPVAFQCGTGGRIKLKKQRNQPRLNPALGGERRLWRR